MTHNVITLWQPIDVVIMFIAALVFFFCFGFALWKSLCSTKSTIYWQVVLCISLIGIGIASFAAMQNNMWESGVIGGGAFLTVAALMTMGGILHNAIRLYVSNRLQERLIARFR